MRSSDFRNNLLSHIFGYRLTLAIQIHEGGIQTDQANTGLRLPQSGALLGVVEGVCRKETVGVW